MLSSRVRTHVFHDNRAPMMHATALRLSVALLLLAWRPGLAQVPEPAVDRVIEAIDGGLYRARDAARSTVFLVTTEGIVLADPLNLDFARWLDAEFQKRFPGQPVRYVVFTTADFDRAGGGGVFTDTAELTAGDAFNQRIAEQRATLPPRFAALDRNATGALESGEIDASAAAEAIRRRDRNGDGHVTANEFWNDVLPAESTYSGHRTIVLGNVRVELIRPGRPGAPELGLVYFPAQRVLFAGAPPSLTAPFADGGLRPVDMAAWARAVEPLAFDTLETGAGTTVPHADVALLTRYVEELLTGVAAGYENGRTVDDLQRSPLLDGFRGTAIAATRDADISFVYRNSRLLAGEAYGAGTVNLAWTGVHPICGGSCTPAMLTPRVAGGTAGVAISVRRARGGAEVHVSPQFNAAVRVAGAPYQIGRRDTVVAFPAGLRVAAPGGSMDITLLLGPSIAFTKGVVTAPPRPAGPTGGPNVFFMSALRFGLTMGGDVRVPLAGGMSLLLPVRVTWLRGNIDFDSTRDVRVGAGVTVRLFRTAG